ncbi:hypothetical protein H7K28_12565 [Paenibacillus polymyxa]|jgi:hypothetical protein|uniref:hypothetical protein n=1 Tax=Paenibacillus TaxID=44249 RepID=UPI000D31D304|nr:MULTISPECIES: hypothetical protein [Paenibacillus]KAF6616165.1 hypothetical protein HFE00_16705 [Paenibacillus sp. EKM101P]KAF6617999.1 hypothetical protein HFE03_23240 [Paenibacillus sp. EKM102P]KAF6626075.1 hypothetical protein HFE01_23200 [Paenibacillus sp. EKM10P]KAF6642572.1 hypothetical protein HFE02_23245 [Paenibacillus sp. EKM11P]MBY0020905.1 hypothetical protein [Paenibacillus polymyxa]
MNILLDIIHWFINNVDTLQQVHDNTVDELIRYYELYVAYRQFRKTHQEPSPPDQEKVDSSENDVNKNDNA